jgi:ubiquinol-cytochrome c reductase cytochrome b subunit
VAMFASILIFFFLPWLDRSPVKSIRYKGAISKVALGTFAVSFIVLAWIGTQPPEPILTQTARVFTVLYFLFFLLMPIYSRLGKTKPVPERVTS